MAPSGGFTLLVKAVQKFVSEDYAGALVLYNIQQVSIFAHEVVGMSSSAAARNLLSLHP